MPELLERQEELAAIDAALQAARTGTGAVVLVEGPAGIGKTSLIDHARDRADTRGLGRLDCRCTPMTPGVPHVVVRDWFGLRARRAGAGNPPFDGPGAALVEAGSPVGDLVFGARWVLEEDTRSRPALLVVDDVHWADDASLAFLDQLVTGLDRLPCVLLLGLRTGEPVAAPEHLARLRSRAQVLTPAPLSPEAVRTLVPDARAADEISRLSGGVPFYVRELAASPDLGTRRAPRSVVESLTARLERLGPVATGVARAVAVLEGAGGVPAVAALAGVPPDEVAGHLERLAAAEVLDAEGTRAVHPLVGEALVAGMEASDRYAAHAAAASLLAGLGISPDVVAGHLARTAPADDARVREQLHRAGERALARGAPKTAARLLVRATEELGVTPGDVDLLALTARATAASGDIDEAAVLWRRAAQLAEDPDRAAVLLADAGDALLTAGHHGEAYAAYASGLSPLADDSPARKVLTARMVMVGLMTDGEADDLRRLVAAVAAQPEEEDEHEDRVLLAAAACAQAFGGRGADEVRALMVRSAGGGALAREETAQGAALYLATGVLTWVDCFDEALTLLDSAVEEAREHRWHDALGTASYCRGYIRMRDGEIAAALDDFGTAQALRELGWNAYVPVLLSALVECHLARGEPDQAALHADELRVASTLPVAVLAAYAHRGLGDLAQARGAHAEAAESFRAAGEALAGVTDNPTIMPWRSRAAISLAHVDRVGQARELAEAEVGLARAWGAPRALSEALLLQARLEPPARRESVLREALEVARSGRTGMVGHEIALALAEVLLARGRAADTDEVAALATPVDAYAEAQGLTPLGARAARLLGTLGLVAVSRVSTDGSGLSPAERRVADLAAAGLTNRQIAGYLFLTVKAVEWHLSASYRKLGISSRRQLAAALGLPPGGDARAQSVAAEVYRRVGPTDLS